MKDTSELLSENFHICPENQIFFNCYHINKVLDQQSYRLYKYKLEAADAKLRFAALAYQEVLKITDELEIGEFIYFDDQSRLKMSFHLESFLVFARAGMDLAVSAFYIYFNNRTNVDSTNELIKKLKKDDSWLPPFSQSFWREAINLYDANEFNWIKALVGATGGVALRDKVVHKGSILIDTIINDNDRGCFIIHIDSNNIGYLVPWLIKIFAEINQLMIIIEKDILMFDAGDWQRIIDISKKNE